MDAVALPINPSLSCLQHFLGTRCRGPGDLGLELNSKERDLEQYKTTHLLRAAILEVMKQVAQAVAKISQY